MSKTKIHVYRGDKINLNSHLDFSFDISFPEGGREGRREGGHTWSMKPGLLIMLCIICRIIGLSIVCRTCSMPGGAPPREGSRENN